MSVVALAREADFETWRAAARRLAVAGARPDTVIWRTPGANDNLFDAGQEASAEVPAAGEIRAPREFIDTAKLIVCHGDADRYDLLYRILLRLQTEADLWNRAIDPDIYRLTGMARAVRRDRHKMTAFVRFREVVTEQGPAHIAWFEPSHHIVELTAPFFVERFAAMRWSILTPERSARWDGSTLAFGPGALKSQAPAEDAFEEVWKTYYASIFNPARLKPDAMRREMPKKYWANLPEASSAN